jgi:hypothetical protein
MQAIGLKLILILAVRLSFLAFRQNKYPQHRLPGYAPIPSAIGLKASSIPTVGSYSTSILTII